MTPVELTMRSATESVLKDLVPTDGEWFNQTQEEGIRIHVTQHSSLRYYIANKALQNTTIKGPQHLKVRSHWRLSKATAKVLLWCFPSFWVNVLLKLRKDLFTNDIAFAFAFVQCEQALKHYSHILMMPYVAKQLWITMKCLSYPQIFSVYEFEYLRIDLFKACQSLGLLFLFRFNSFVNNSVSFTFRIYHYSQPQSTYFFFLTLTNTVYLYLRVTILW